MDLSARSPSRQSWCLVRQFDVARIVNVTIGGLTAIGLSPSLIEFQWRLRDKVACAAYLLEVHWLTGSCCLACRHDKGRKFYDGARA